MASGEDGLVGPSRALQGANPHFHDVISERGAAPARDFCRDAPEEAGRERRASAPGSWRPAHGFLSGPRGSAGMRRLPGCHAQETRHGLQVDHPRYPVLPKIGMSTAPLALFAATLPLLRRQIREGRDFDLIDAHYFYPDGVAAVLLGARSRPPGRRYRPRQRSQSDRHGIAIPRRWIRWAARHADGLIAVSSGLKQRLVELGIAAERVRVLRNGVDLALFRPHDRETARQALGFTRPTLLAVGNLVPLKRHQLMVEALTQLPECRARHCRRGPERAAIERVARERGSPTASACSAACRRIAFPKSTAQPISCCWFRATKAGPMCCWRAWPAARRSSSPTSAAIADIVGARRGGAHRGRDHAQTDSPPRSATLLAAPPARAATRCYAEQFDWQSTTEGQIALFREILEQRSKE